MHRLYKEPTTAGGADAAAFLPETPCFRRRRALRRQAHAAHEAVEARVGAQRPPLWHNIQRNEPTLARLIALFEPGARLIAIAEGLRNASNFPLVRIASGKLTIPAHRIR